MKCILMDKVVHTCDYCRRLPSPHLLRMSLESLEAEAAEVASALNEAEKKLAEADKALEAATGVVAEVMKKKEALGDSEGRRGRAGKCAPWQKGHCHTRSHEASAPSH